MKTTITQIQADRIRILADFLDKLPSTARDHFNMSTFGSGGLLKRKLGHCGTVACAAGWGAECPALRKQGYKRDDSFDRRNNGVLFFDGTRYDRAVSTFFGAYDGLFDCTLGEKIKTPKQWAKHARRWLAKECVVQG